jgi:hypothetical protein
MNSLPTLPFTSTPVVIDACLASRPTIPSVKVISGCFVRWKIVGGWDRVARVGGVLPEFKHSLEVKFVEIVIDHPAKGLQSDEVFDCDDKVLESSSEFQS